MEKRENSLILKTNVANRYLFSTINLTRLESFWGFWGCEIKKSSASVGVAISEEIWQQGQEGANYLCEYCRFSEEASAELLEIDHSNRDRTKEQIHLKSDFDLSAI